MLSVLLRVVYFYMKNGNLQVWLPISRHFTIKILKSPGLAF